jgi:hypothetical protein
MRLSTIMFEIVAVMCSLSVLVQSLDIDIDIDIDITPPPDSGDEPAITMYVQNLYSSEFLSTVDSDDDLAELLSIQELRIMPKTNEIKRTSRSSSEYELPPTGQFVYGDKRNVLKGGPITYGALGHLYNDTRALSASDQYHWFRQAIAQWSQLDCMKGKPLPYEVVDVPHPEWSGFVADWSKTQIPNWDLVQADIQIAGFISGTENPELGMNSFAVASCITICWPKDRYTDTDIDGDGLCDAAIVSACLLACLLEYYTNTVLRNDQRDVMFVD